MRVKTFFVISLFLFLLLGLSAYPQDEAQKNDNDELDKVDVSTLIESAKKNINNQESFISLSNSIFKKYARLFFEHRQYDKKQNILSESIDTLQKKIKNTSFPQNIKTKAQLEKLTSELREITEIKKDIEKEGKKILEFFSINADQLSRYLEKDIEQINSKIESFKLKTGTHVQRLADQRDDEKILQQLLQRIKATPDILSKDSPFILIDDPTILISGDKNKDAFKRIETRLDSLEKETVFLKTRLDEIQLEIDELRNLIYY